MKKFAWLLLLATCFVVGTAWAVTPDGQETARPGGPAQAADQDTDGDGLSDFQEIHKYRTDPTRKDTAGIGVSDGEWQQRREFTYSVRAKTRVMPPYNLKALNDDYQDVRVRKETKDFVELEVVDQDPRPGQVELIAERVDVGRDQPEVLGDEP